MTRLNLSIAQFLIRFLATVVRASLFILAMMPLMANAQPSVSASAEPSELATVIRQWIGNFDSWDLDYLANYEDVFIVGMLASIANDRIEWRDMIPLRIRNDHGEDASRMFVLAAFDALAHAPPDRRYGHGYDIEFTSNLRTDLARELRLSFDEQSNLAIDQPLAISLSNGERITATPAQALMQQVSRMSTSSELSDLREEPPAGTPFFGTLGGIIAIPNSLLDALKDTNPLYADRLEELRGRPVFIVDPMNAYTAGQIVQMRGADNIVDWRVDARNLPLTCQQVTVAERRLTNSVRRDVRVDVAFNAGRIRRSGLCGAGR